jgi:hypothetical protein
MRVSKMGIVSVLALAFLTTPAKAEPSAAQFLSDIAKGGTAQLWMLYSYSVGFQWANAQVRYDKGKPLFCQAGKLAITPDQNAQILRDYVSRHPDKGKTQAGLVLLMAYQETFPC